MLIYEYRVRDEFLRLREYATNVRDKFQRDASPEDLLLDVKSLRVHYERLNEMLPEQVQGKSNADRHIGFMEYWLGKKDRNACGSDIEDLCERDITELENAFQAWCKNPDHYDSELVMAISDLLAHRQLDSAIRKGFIVLKERLCKRFRVSRELDGTDLVNTIFGKNSESIKSLSEPERHAMRDLLAGLYGVFRNRFAHRDEEPSWAEADAVISMINHVLQEVSRIK
jgi:Protein of unknown function (Hypoth_ymh)